MSRPIFDSGRDEPTMNINPSWLIQTAVLLMVGTLGYFMDSSLKDIKEEMQLARLERAQLRSDLSSVELGYTGDRFTRSDWERGRAEIQKQIDELRRDLRTSEGSR